MKFAVKSFGCQMNKLDTSLVTAALKDAGCVLTDSVKQADAVLINTCSVREHAEQRVISHLGRLKHIRKTRPELIVAVIGCMAQRLGAELLERHNVDLVCGPAQIPQITQLLQDARKTKQKIIAVTEKIRKNPESTALEEFESIHSAADRAVPGQAFVRVMRGCDNFCSYCIVPYVRGPEISRPPNAVIDQIKKLAQTGVKLVTLLGQRVNAYCYVAGEKTCCLADLLEMASRIDAIKWIRFVTSYPSETFFHPILRAMRDLPKVCPYLHIPAQSGADRILKAMNRRYTAAQYLHMLARAREIVPGLEIAGDFIVGFPGETDQDFDATVELVKKARYKNAFIFKYSPRPVTHAERNLADNVPVDVKKQRNIELLAVQERISGALARKFLNKRLTVLVEGLSKKPHLNRSEEPESPQLLGRTEHDWIVVFNGPEELTGSFAEVKITNTTPLTLFGQLLPQG